VGGGGEEGGRIQKAASRLNTWSSRAIEVGKLSEISHQHERGAGGLQDTTATKKKSSKTDQKREHHPLEFGEIGTRSKD